MLPLYLNGKFAAQPTTGVQRVAGQLLRGIDRSLRRGEWPGPVVLLVPAAATVPGGLREVAVQRVQGSVRLHLWEQRDLPKAASDGLLLNLSGSAPAFARRQACMVHDAAVFDHGDAYTLPFRLWYRWLFRRLARGAACVMLTPSAFSRGRLAATLRVPPSRLRIVPLGADHLDGVAPDRSLLDRHGLLDKPFLLAVGSANPTKNLPALVQAWRELGRSDARLVLAGGANDAVFRDQERVDMAGVVSLGPVDDAALKALYSSATGLVCPSLYEGFGLPPLEAMREGCPVAAAAAGSLPEVCGDAALMFDPRSISAIAHAMRCLLDDAPTRDRLRVAGQRRAAEFSWDDATRQLRAALEGAA